MIDLQPSDRAAVMAILAAHIPAEWAVWAFGSRVTGGARPWSDLDLAIAAPTPADWRDLERLKDAFADSDLPFSVDVVDLAQVTPSLAVRIRSEGMPLRHGGKLSA